MANEYSSTSNSSGLLKPMYEDGLTPLEASLKKKREKLAETKGIDVEDENE